MANLASYEQELTPYDFHYQRLQRKVRETMPQIKITSIRQVHNKYLSLAFTVKENEIQRRNGASTIEEYMHATGETKVASIIKGNLDWRMISRSKYGKGVSFSHSASYANKYCNNRNGWRRAFVFCDVLVGTAMRVSDNWDTHPPKTIDSYQTHLVLVKFDDFTFNPKFVVYYDYRAYGTDSSQCNDIIYSRQYDFNDSSTQDRIWNQEQRTLLQQILRFPFHNEDYFNPMVAENHKRIQKVVQSMPSELSNQLPDMPNYPEVIETDVQPVTPNDTEPTETDEKRPELLPIENDEGIQEITPPRTNIETNYLPTVSSIEGILVDLENGAYSHGRFVEPTPPPNRKCTKLFLITLLIIFVIGCIGIYYELSLRQTKINRFTQLKITKL